MVGLERMLWFGKDLREEERLTVVWVEEVEKEGRVCGCTKLSDGFRRLIGLLRRRKGYVENLVLVGCWLRRKLEEWEGWRTTSGSEVVEVVESLLLHLPL